MVIETDVIDQIFNLHLTILKEILVSKDVDNVLQHHSSIIDKLNYLEIAKDRKLLTFDENNKLIGAYPVSPIKSKFEIEIECLGQGYAMCAIDALGIAYTFNSKVQIKATDLSTNKTMEIFIDPQKDNITSSKDYFVTYKDPSKVSVIATQQCPVIQFYSDKDSIPENDPDIRILSFREAFIHAKNIFNPESIKNSIKSGFKPF